MKISVLLFLIAITGITVFGITMSVLSFIGNFDPEIPANIIDFTKDYLISYTISEPQLIPPGESRVIGHGETGFAKLQGKLILESNSLSAQNPIHITIELRPDEKFEDESWNVFPDDYFAYFPKAGKYNNTDNTANYEKTVIIPLEKTFEPNIISGDDWIIFPHEEDYKFEVLDPLELDTLKDLRGEHTLRYNLNEEYGIALLQESKYNSNISIDSSNAIQNILIDRKAGFYFWVTFTIAVPSVIFAIGKFVVRLKFQKKS